MAEYKLGNKALELYRYTLQVTKPVADDKIDARDAAAEVSAIIGVRLTARPKIRKSKYDDARKMVKKLRRQGWKPPGQRGNKKEE